MTGILSCIQPTNYVNCIGYTPSPSVDPLLLMTFFYHILLVPKLVCRNICERIHSKKILFGKSNYSVGKKYCRRCEVYIYHNEGIFCPCCGMQLRLTPSKRGEGKERLRQERRIVTIRK
jgi:ribosomal protein L37E